MKKISILFFTCFAIIHLSKGGNDFLKLDHSCSSLHSGFSKVNVIDNRAGKQLLGLVQLGGFNRMEQVKFDGSFPDSLATFFLAGDSTKSNGRELTIILYELFVSEKTGGMSETGRFKLSMRLFEKVQSSGFQETLMVDSVYRIQASDATKKLLRLVSEELCEIATIVSEKKPESDLNLPKYSIEELYTLDSLEKLKIPIYNTDNFTPGIFIDYDHFKNNNSDHSTISYDTTVNGKINVYKWDEVKQKKVKLKVGSFYAASDGKNIIKSTSVGFYNLEKIGFDFYYTGKTSFYNSMNNAYMMYAMFGITGAIIANSVNNTNEQLFRLKLNYLTGHSIPLSLPKYEN